MTRQPRRPQLPVWLLLAASLLTLASGLRAEEMKIFELQGATPQELIPLIKPFVGPDGTVTGMHNQLIVRTSAERMGEIERIVQTFDRAPQRLLIHVRDSAPETAESERIGLSVDSPHVRIGEGGQSGVRIKRYTTETQETSERTLQTIEGQPVLISSGVSLPVVTRSGVFGGPHAGYQEGYGYREVDSGFYATVRLLGEQVRIEIATRKQTPLQGSPVISQQSTDNVVSGRLGEWLQLAGTRQQRRVEGTGIAATASSASARESELWVKVERLPD